ncbi:hypothetical protein C5975_07965 [Cronobacter sakazakii]|nr:hypothetical protein C5934_14420 [Cronobacter sakazakii]PQX76838.1 hypothetical protein C5975_07965 [Cronobacter sakazakii]PQX88386.1 hypothetical protein C5932_10075 [Cronobacter sakazakii]PQY56788.1 hypothetical protein C5954_14970 [Cronobacter sakazakii]PUV59338.1 hypothetical protein CDT88_01880 [Cronobacter sakazakii]
MRPRRAPTPCYGATRHLVPRSAAPDGSIKRRNGFFGMISCRAPRCLTAVYPDFHAPHRCGVKAAILNIGIM